MKGLLLLRRYLDPVYQNLKANIKTTITFVILIFLCVFLINLAYSYIISINFNLDERIIKNEKLKIIKVSTRLSNPITHEVNEKVNTDGIQILPGIQDRGKFSVEEVERIRDKLPNGSILFHDYSIRTIDDNNESFNLMGIEKEVLGIFDLDLGLLSEPNAIILNISQIDEKNQEKYKLGDTITLTYYDYLSSDSNEHYLKLKIVGFVNNANMLAMMDLHPNTSFINIEIAKDAFITTYYGDMKIYEEIGMSNEFYVYVPQAKNVSMAIQILEDNNFNAYVIGDVVKGFVDYSNVVTQVGIGIIAILFVIAIAITANLIRQILTIRRREFGLYKIIGYKKRQIFNLFLWEILSSSLIGSLLAMFMLFLLYEGISVVGAVNIELKMHWMQPVISISVVFIIIYLILFFTFKRLHRQYIIYFLKESNN